MKRFGKKLVMVLAVLMCGVIAFAGAACQRGGGKDTIAVIAKGETHAFWQAVKSGAMAAGEEYGYNVTFKGPVGESEEYVGTQREMVQAALGNASTKAMVLATIGLGFTDELVTAFEKGIPVVEFDSGLYSDGADITEGKDPTVGSVATDNKAAAAVVAENFYKYLKDNNKLTAGPTYHVGVIRHDATATGLDRANGFIEKIQALAQADGFTIEIHLQAKTNNAGEYKAALQALNNEGVSAIFMTNEGVVNEVYPEVSDNADTYKNILFCGFDCGTNQYDWIKDAGKTYGLLVGSVAQDSYNIGYKAVELAAKKLAGETVSDVGIGGRWYTSENIDQLEEENIFYKG